jgi:Fic family protein
MAFQPEFTVTAKILELVEEIAGLREKILAATVQVAWVPKLQRDSRIRNAHSSTAIEGNPLTMEQVRLLEEGESLPTQPERSTLEVLNYLAGLRFIEKHSSRKTVTHAEILKLHSIIGSGVMDQGAAGRYRDIRVRVGKYLPPPPEMVSGLMAELLDWWNKGAAEWSPLLSSAIIHYQFEDIHPFADGNGRTGRALALWELYRRGFDTRHIFSVDEAYWQDRPAYYAALADVQGGDLTSWLEYSAKAIRLTLEQLWLRVQHFSVTSGEKRIVLRPKQEALLRLLRDRQSLTPQEVRDSIGISKQGAMDLLNPLLQAGMIRRIGTRKSGRYILS